LLGCPFPGIGVWTFEFMRDILDFEYCINNI
jgi:hypothetical protein